MIPLPLVMMRFRPMVPLILMTKEQIGADGDTHAPSAYKRPRLDAHSECIIITRRCGRPSTALFG